MENAHDTPLNKMLRMVNSRLGDRSTWDGSSKQCMAHGD